MKSRPAKAGRYDGRSWRPPLGGRLALLLLLLAVPHPSAQSPSVTSQLDRYLGGQFDAVNAEFEKLGDKGGLLDQLQSHAPAWIERDGIDGRKRRRLAAATLALEAARLSPAPWSKLEAAPDYVGGCGPDGKQPRAILYWQPPVQLLKWGASLFESEKSTPDERIWRIAAVAIAQKRGEREFLRSANECLVNPSAEIDFLVSTRKRFPMEPRFQMAEAIITDALKLPKSAGTFTFEQLLDDLDLGGEAALRLGQFDKALMKSRDPWVVRLARAGKTGTQPQAAPGRVMMTSSGKPAAMSSAELREADYRFWPELTLRLRGVIAPPEIVPPAPVAVFVPTGSLLVDTLAKLYEGGDANALTRAVQQAVDLPRTLREMSAALSPWPDNPRREAVFRLEVAAAALWLPTQGVHDQARMLISSYLALVRAPLGPDGFECAWYRAEAAAFEGPVRPAGVLSFIERAQQRCPDDARLALAGAVLADQLFPLGTSTRVPGQTIATGPPAGRKSILTAAYDRARIDPETGAEANIRLAWFHYRIGEFNEAAELLKGIDGLTSDRLLLYYGRLIHGHVLRAQKQPEAARAAFLSALTAWPDAQSPHVELMTLALLGRDPAETQRRAEIVQTAASGKFDPWWMYWQGDYRDFRRIMTELREMAK